MSREFQGVVGKGYRVTIPKWVREDLSVEIGDVLVLEVKKVIKRGKENPQI